MTKKVYSAVKLPEETIKILEDADIKLNMFDKLDTPSEEEIIENVKDVDAIITGVNVTVTKKIIESSKNLKIIANVGAGVNNIDIESAKENNVLLTNTPGQNSVASTAETAIALMLTLSRGILKNQKMVKENSFEGWQVMGFLGGNQVSHKKLFIDGFGNIGKEIARMAKGLHMDIFYYDIKDRSEFKEAEEEIGAKFVEFEEGLKNADYIVLQMNYTKDNHHLIGEKELEMMKETAYLINTARGGIVDEKALYKALEVGKIKGAAIDTHEEEPKINEDLMKLDNVVLTPHIGNDTYEARVEMANTAAKDLVRVLDGKEPKYLVEG
ncbi:MAG: NAD(P)-dependent oxidoreductase [Lagierella massiliensis]|nr:NAD(P)-dependent oxidoreductase [Lagierella massiliensis]